MGASRDRDLAISRFIRSNTGIPYLDKVTRGGRPAFHADGIDFILGINRPGQSWTETLSVLPEDGIAAVVRYHRRTAGSPGEALVVTRLRNYTPLVEVWVDHNKDRLLEAEKGRE